MSTLLLLIIVYLAIGVLYLAGRAMHCLSTHAHFDFSVELLGALVWFGSALFWIWLASVKTRKHPRPWR